MSKAIPNMVIRVLKAITRVLMFISCIAISILALYTVYDVIMRFVFQKPSSGATEWGQMLLIISMLTIGYALAEGRVTSVGVFVERLPKKVNIALELIMGILSIAFFVLVGWQLLAQIGPSIKFKETYFILKTPRWPMYAVLGVSFLGSTLGAIAYVIEHIINFKDPKDKDIFEENPDLAILAHVEEEERENLNKTENSNREEGA